MRFVIGVVLALSVGIGAYLGSAQVADSAKTPPRRVTLQMGDIAVAGQVQCRAWTDSRSLPVHPAYMQCSKGPWNRAFRAGVSVFVTPYGINFSKKVGKAQCYLAAPAAYGRYAHPIFSAELRCQKGPHAVSSAQIEVLPDGITVLHKGQRVYTTGGWGG